jgi:bacteriocin-like protein
MKNNLNVKELSSINGGKKVNWGCSVAMGTAFATGVLSGNAFVLGGGLGIANAEFCG